MQTTTKKKDNSKFLKEYEKLKPEPSKGGKTAIALSICIILSRKAPNESTLSFLAFRYEGCPSLPAQYIAIHGRLFYGIYAHAGKMRDYNISKKE